MAGSRSRRPPAPRRRAIRASAARVRPGAPEFTRPRQPWQKQVEAYFDEIGEVKYAAGSYARMLSKIEIYPAVISEDGKSIQRVTDERVVGIVDRVLDPTARAQLQARYGTLIFLYGEGYLVVTFTDDGEEWEMLSPFELTPLSNDTYQRDRGDGSPVEKLSEVQNPDDAQPGEIMAWRLWQPHITKSGQADSPMRGVRTICEQLLTLDRAIRARGLSRFAGAGILVIPDDASLVGDQPDAFDEDDTPSGDATEDAGEDPFLKDLTDSIVEPMKDQGSASAVVPLVMRVSGDYVDKIKHITLGDSSGYPEKDQIEQTLRRLALGLDMPPEELLGKGDLNHWTGWLVSREAWQSHGMPVAEKLCADLTKAYFQPALEALGITSVTVDQPNVENPLGDPASPEPASPADATSTVATVTRQIQPQDVFLAFDDSAVVLNPDRAKDTKDAVALGLISDAAARRELGFDEVDAASVDEKAVRVTKVTDRLQPGEQPSDVVEGTPSEPAAPAASIAAAARIAGALELAVERCIEAAGVRVKRRLQGNPDLAERYKSTPARDLPQLLGADVVHTLFDGPGCERALVAGVVDEILGRRVNGSRPVLLAAVESAAAKALYGGPVDLSPGLLALVVEEARAQA